MDRAIREMNDKYNSICQNYSNNTNMSVCGIQVVRSTVKICQYKKSKGKSNNWGKMSQALYKHH